MLLMLCVPLVSPRLFQGVERERPLSELERDKYEDLLRKLTVRSREWGGGHKV